MPAQITFKGGLDLRFLPDPDFEPITGSKAEQAAATTRNVLRVLLMGWPEKWHELISWSTLKAVFVEHDPELLKALRFAFQCGFEYLFAQLKDKKLNADESEQVQLYLSNCMCLLPISDLTPYESVKLPQCIEGEWTLVEYQVEPIELTPKTGLRRLFIRDRDRVFAYGLEPIANPKAQPHLIFMGTTYPAGQGFVPQVNTDLKGFETVGTALYKSGQYRLRQWLVRQHDKVHVCGISLGGSLSLLLAINQGDLLSRVDAMNPAGLHEPWLNQDSTDRWDEIKSKPQVVVQIQDRDPVSFFGVWKDDWQILNVIPPRHKQGPNAFCDHVLNYAGFAETQFTYLDPKEHNANRKIRNIGLYSLGRGLIYYPSIVPYNFLIRPALYWLWENKAFTLFALIGLMAVISLVALSIVPVLGAMIIFAALLGLASIISSNLPENFQHLSNQTLDYAQLHHPSLARNPELDIYNPNNTIELKVTFKEINTYYKTMRCLVKQKEFLPKDNKIKRDLLLASGDPANADIEVPLKITKAKAIHIRRTIGFIKQLGEENTAKLKSVLTENYQHYRAGKCP